MPAWSLAHCISLTGGCHYRVLLLRCCQEGRLVRVHQERRDKSVVRSGQSKWVTSVGQAASRAGAAARVVRSPSRRVTRPSLLGGGAGCAHGSADSLAASCCSCDMTAESRLHSALRSACGCAGRGWRARVGQSVERQHSQRAAAPSTSIISTPAKTHCIPLCPPAAAACGSGSSPAQPTGRGAASRCPARTACERASRK